MEESDYVKRVVRLGICIYTQILCFSLILILAGLDISNAFAIWPGKKKKKTIVAF